LDSLLTVWQNSDILLNTSNDESEHGCFTFQDLHLGLIAINACGLRNVLTTGSCPKHFDNFLIPISFRFIKPVFRRFPYFQKN